jgi:hypothetical protein
MAAALDLPSVGVRGQVITITVRAGAMARIADLGRVLGPPAPVGAPWLGGPRRREAVLPLSSVRLTVHAPAAQASISTTT